jgi:hypothetical protein
VIDLTVTGYNPPWTDFLSASEAPLPSGPIRINRVKGGRFTYEWHADIINVGGGIKDKFFHELGHKFDHDNLTTAHREALLPLLRTQVWAEGWNREGAERFASSYAGMALGGRNAGALHFDLDWIKSKKQWRKIKAIIREAAIV